MRHGEYNLNAVAVAGAAAMTGRSKRQQKQEREQKYWDRVWAHAKAYTHPWIRYRKKAYTAYFDAVLSAFVEQWEGRGDAVLTGQKPGSRRS